MFDLSTKMAILNIAVRLVGEGAAPKDVEVMFETLVTIVFDDWPKKKFVSETSAPIDHINV